LPSCTKPSEILLQDQIWYRETGFEITAVIAREKDTADVPLPLKYSVTGSTDTGSRLVHIYNPQGLHEDDLITCVIRPNYKSTVRNAGAGFTFADHPCRNTAV